MKTKQYGFHLVRHPQKDIAFTGIQTQDPDHNPEHTYAQDRSAVAYFDSGKCSILFAHVK